MVHLQWKIGMLSLFIERKNRAAQIDDKCNNQKKCWIYPYHKHLGPPPHPGEKIPKIFLQQKPTKCKTWTQNCPRTILKPSLSGQNFNDIKDIIIYMRVVLNSFIWKRSSSPKKNYFRRTFANSMFFFRGTCWPRFLRKTWMCDILKLFQASDPSSHFILRQLYLNIYVLL